MRNIALTIQYNGAAYHGWQRQKDVIAVQQVVEDTLGDITGAEITLYGCGRTDAGVHAIEYSCNFRTESAIPCDKLPYVLNQQLPPDISCLSACDMPQGFHARYDARGKRYIYKILNKPMKDVFLSSQAWHYRQPLDITLMQEACAAFVGEHDFTSMCSVDSTVDSKVRTIYELSVKHDGDFIVIDIHGSGFLYNMVRIITGTLVYVGIGKLTAADIPPIINAMDRTKAGITAPPQGLYMAKVYYE